MPSFAHLHTHTQYSLLDGFSQIPRLMENVKQMGMPAVGITDHGAMYGVIEFYDAAIAAGIHPVIGMESYMAARTMVDRDVALDRSSAHILLLAQNDRGYANLIQMASIAQLQGFYYYPRIDHEVLVAHAEGIITTTGCMAAEIPDAILHHDYERAEKLFKWYLGIFGHENFYVELQVHNIPEILQMNRVLMDFGKKYDVPLLATNDVHYLSREDATYQDVMLAVQTGCMVDDPKRFRMSDNSYYLRSPEEMASLFANIPEALENSLRVAERCQVDLSFKGYQLPDFPVPDGFTAETYLRHLCEEGVGRAYGSAANSPEVTQRINYELDIIHKMGFDAYFLIVHDLCRHAREEGIWYNARGSAAGSIVARCLDITSVEPLSQGLIFERFLNPARVNMPDIDLDFQSDRRGEIIAYCVRRYGEDHVASIITFGTMKARAALRDVARVTGVPIPEVDRIAKLIPNVAADSLTLAEALEEIPELKSIYTSGSSARKLIDVSMHLEGSIRSVGTHAAGVVITPKPLMEHAPLRRPTGAAADETSLGQVVQFEMGTIERMGLLKVDFLGLQTLTAMQRACKLIQERHGIELTLANIPVNDPGSFELLGAGETVGVFQVESSGMRKNLRAMQPHELSQIVAMVALYRPGPMGFIPDYIARMHGRQSTFYRHPLLEPILKETYGVPVYQEQIMRAVMDLAGYTASEADEFRKVIAKKKSEKIAYHRKKFVKGAGEHGIDAETATAIFGDWEEFAHYAFNRAHAADYGRIAVQTAYLKKHYPLEYMAALLSVFSGETDKIAVYAADARRMGITILPPSVLASGVDFQIEKVPGEGDAIRFGLCAVKNVGVTAARDLVTMRAEQRAETLAEFANQVNFRGVGKKAVESLIRVGAFDAFGHRTSILRILDKLLDYSTAQAKKKSQAELLGRNVVYGDLPLPEKDPNVSDRDLLEWERELTGVYLTGHPLAKIASYIDKAATSYSTDLSSIAEGERVTVAGEITELRPYTTKGGKLMAFATLEDLHGKIDLIIFNKVWSVYRGQLSVGSVVAVSGKAEKGEILRVVVDHVATDIKRLANSAVSAPVRRPDRSSATVFRNAGKVEGLEQDAVPPASIPLRYEDGGVLELRIPVPTGTMSQLEIARMCLSLASERIGQDRLAIRLEMADGTRPVEFDFPGVLINANSTLMERLAKILPADAIRFEPAPAV
jgi:DNA-directed DNA polymerase III (polc)